MSKLQGLRAGRLDRNVRWITHSPQVCRRSGKCRTTAQRFSSTLELELHSLEFIEFARLEYPLPCAEVGTVERGNWSSREATEDRVVEREEDIDSWLIIDRGEPLADSKAEAHETDQIGRPLRRHRPPRCRVNRTTTWT